MLIDSEIYNLIQIKQSIPKALKNIYLVIILINKDCSYSILGHVLDIVENNLDAKKF